MSRPLCTGVVIAWAAWLLAALPAAAQNEPRDVPSATYFAAFTDFYDGEYKDALDTFSREGRDSAIETSQSQWIDSICYYTMRGECHYQVGELDKALDQYNRALLLFARFSNWMIRVQFPPSIRAGNVSAARAPTWGISGRGAKLGHYPSTMLMGQGQVDNNAPIRQGGVVQQPVLLPVHVEEIVRTTALALRRRAELLGPLAVQDPLTNEVVSALMRRPAPPNHWSEAWIDLQLGIALYSAGKDTQALASLQRSVLAAGVFDHPFTSTALLLLGQAAFAQGNYPESVKLFTEATYAAVLYPDPGVLEEAFRYACVAHLMTNRKTIYPPLVAAATWAKVKGLRQLQASLQLAAAENLAILGQTTDAAKLLDEARRTVGRRTMAIGRIGARLNYLTALVRYQERRVPEGDNALALAMRYMQGGSHWLYQMRFADAAYAKKTLTPRLAMEYYRGLLRDPQPLDWAAQPMESMAVMTTPHPGPHERWFEAAIERKDFDAALEIADRARRHRFASTLALGGRLQGLRWTLAAPSESLDRQNQLTRQELLSHYPRFAEAADRAEKIRQELAARPPVAENPEALREQLPGLAQLAAISGQQEAMLREIALRREPGDAVFPPIYATAQIQQSLADRHAVLAFFAAGGRLYGFLLNNKRSACWEVAGANALPRRIGDLLRQMGNFDANRELPQEELANDGWKQAAADLLDALVKASPQVDFAQPLDELIVVPEGALWYLPFEALQVQIDGRLQPLVSRFRIRYAPTASLAVADGRGPRGGRTTGGAVGMFFGRDSQPAAHAALAQIAAVLPGTAALPTPLPGPSAVYAGLFDRLIVLDDLPAAEQGPYAVAPLGIDRGKAGSSLAEWMALPWRGPEELLLPGFHTAAEGAMKRTTAGAAGADVFLSLCGLLSCGSRTILMSRWRVGGQSTYDLVREYAQELPHTSAADAWQRSVLLTMEAPLVVEAEPRVKRQASGDGAKASHPFFWAGYMLVDSSAGGPPGSGAKPAQPGGAPTGGPNVAPGQPKPAPPGEPAAGQPGGQPKPAAQPSVPAQDPTVLNDSTEIGPGGRPKEKAPRSAR